MSRVLPARPLLVIVGPTAVGKTALSLRLARDFSGEVISADSRQVYHGLDIGTDKISPARRQGVPHHLLDVVEEQRLAAARSRRPDIRRTRGAKQFLHKGRRAAEQAAR